MTASKNLLLKPVEFKIEETARGIWRKFLYEDGKLFQEFTSHETLFGMPLLHYTRGKNPETGKIKTARGVVAIGQRAVGGIAIGQMATGVIAIGQLAIGGMLGIGQASTGIIAIGQLAISMLFALGQAGVGFVVISQFGFGVFCLSQLAHGLHVIDTRDVSPVAMDFFSGFVQWFRT